MTKTYTNQFVPGAASETGGRKPISLNLPNYINKDYKIQENFEALQTQLNELTSLLSKVVDLNTGVIIGTLDEDILKNSQAGLVPIITPAEVTQHVGGEGVAAGALAVAEDLDDVPDGTTHGKILNTELSGNQVIKLRKTSGSIAVDDIFDVNNNDADDITEGSSNFWAGVSGADFIKSVDSLDDVQDGTTYKKVTGIDGSNKATETSIADKAISGIKFTTAVATALGDYNTDTGPADEGEWEAV